MKDKIKYTNNSKYYKLEAKHNKETKKKKKKK